MLVINKIARKWKGKSFNFYASKLIPFIIEDGRITFIKHQIKVESFKLTEARKARLNPRKASKWGA